MLDLLIIGSGPAALTAALYVARSELKVLVVERAKIGGVLPDITEISNFPGFSGSGEELAHQLRQQVEALDVKITYGEATNLASHGDHISATIDGEEISAKAVLLATGSEPIPLDFTPSAPVSYCALCDAPLYKDKKILVIGGGNSAVGESLMLAQVASSLTLMTHSALTAEKFRIDQLKSLDHVRIIENVEPTAENTAGYDGIFVYIGKRPASSLIGKSHLDESGYIQTAPGTHKISDGLYAAGDVRSDTVKQAITAAGDGAAASIEIINYLQNYGK